MMPPDSSSSAATRRSPPSVVSTVSSPTHAATASFDSVEAAVYPYHNDSGPFSRAGDSGAAIGGINNDLVIQLTGGTGPTDSADIAYGTPMEWLWKDVIKVKFPDTVLFFDGPTTS